MEGDVNSLRRIAERQCWSWTSFQLFFSTFLDDLDELFAGVLNEHLPREGPNDNSPRLAKVEQIGEAA